MAILLGAVYLAVGIAFGQFAGWAASPQMQFFWRLSAYIVSALVFAVHIAYEHSRLRNKILTTAWHTSLAAALGGFGLALAANIHDLASAAGYRPKMLIALIAWPLLTGTPAFVLALVAAASVTLMRRRT
jgi:hypothetical protein